MKDFKNRLLMCVKQALPSGLKTSIWLIKLTLPVSFAVLLLDYFGLLVIMAEYTSPIFKVIGLPGVAALVLITSIFTNIYSVVAVLTTLALPVRDGTILAVMCLISHGFLIETAILKKTGSSATRMLLLRLISSFIVGGILNFILPGSPSDGSYLYQNQSSDLYQTILTWLPQIGTTLLKIVILVNGLLIVQRCLEEFGILKYLTKPLSPFMKLMGLPKESSFLWMIGNTIGLAYGSAVMLQKSEEGQLNKKECDLLNHHLAISHSQLEDPLLFLSLGYSIPILIIPRVLFAIVVVWLRRIENSIRSNN
ncbi:nucleoside recognition protein [Ancylomarina sp. 16SWW S1-10-2]|uniref:nucleoside recognition protein n=1 Tax=Ancylomarina sp. 16SWW S1-10-2 TaxID=2499681 RepID=UPI0012ADE592|nr:nucleoside recognition protein [Ancylomarina sp. 16SWW S1-10-2]MRT94484.1 nucleoside recognition protein [Ancylomarina sp. 16SWW S1-10-2]